MWVWLFLFQVSLAAHVCPPPAVPVNCQVEVTEEAATYKCDEGYTLFGSATRKCNPEDGTWRGKLPVCGTNIAYLRPANQSSTLGNAGASLANDGRATHHHEGSQCAVTTTQVSPWWRVDLLQNYEVVVVVVHTRACCDSPPLQNLEIRVGDSLDIQKNRLCAWEPGNVEQGARVEFVCALPLRGQFVILQTTGRESELSLCEVEVYSTEEFAKERCSTTADIATVGVFNKTCYQFNVKEGASFDNARELCKASASTGDLAHAISPVTHHYLTSELEGRKDALKSELVWVGARRDPGFISRTWRWVDGTVVEETKWGRGQPNNYNGKQDCVALDRGRKWLWNDVGCELDYLPYICMHSPGSCGSPDRKVNTTLEVTSGQTRSQAVYSCPVGSKLVGDSTRYCLQSGFWNGSAPSCKYIDCGVPQQITNGNYTYIGDERNTYMARITYTCAQNYSLGGAHERVCTEEGVWAPEEPACLYARCPALPTPPHATIQADSNSHSAGGTITYICDDGYVLQGNKTVSCQLGGHWSGQPPSCAFTDCGLPHDLQNGQAVLLNKTTTYGSQVAYKCAPNFWLSGTELRTCGTEGQWSGTEPECVLITCGEPEVPPGGYVTGYSFQVGSEVRYRCDEGHRLDVVGASGLERAGQLEREKEDDFNGDLERERVRKREISEAEKGAVYLRECTQDGVWSGVVPECVYIDCGRVQAVPKASITYRDGKTHMHARLTYTCAHGFRLRGNAQRQCSEDGTWSGSDPVCEEVRCPAPPTKEAESSAFLKLISGNDRRLPSAYGRRRGRGRGREREGESYRVGSVATYECPKGYVINTTTAATPTTATTTTTTTTTITTAASTAALLTCTTNGTWSGPVPACSYVDCGLPEKIQNGYYRLLSNTTHFASLVAYECVPNYKVSGRIRRNCLANGTWAGLSPSCEEIRCHNLTLSLPAGLSVAADSLIVTSTARYYCEKGRRIVGNSQRTCNSNGLWNGSQPRCEWVTCQLPQPLKNGRVVRLNETLNYGTIIEYHCLPDYQLFGLFSRTCDEKGLWSGAEPVCVGKDEEYLHENSIGDSSSSTGTTTTTTTATNTGLYTGLIVGLLLIIVFISGLVYLRRRQKAAAAAEEDEAKVRGDRPPLPPPNKTPTITYSNLTDPMTGNNIYENIDEQEEEEEEEGRGGRGGMPIYINNNNYQDAATTTTTTTAATATTGPLASINRPTMSTRRPRLPPPQPPTVPSGVTINGVTISESV